MVLREICGIKRSETAVGPKRRHCCETCRTRFLVLSSFGDDSFAERLTEKKTKKGRRERGHFRRWRGVFPPPRGSSKVSEQRRQAPLNVIESTAPTCPKP